MHFIIHCLDRPGALPTRLANYEAHKAHLSNAPIRIVISGPLTSDDGQTMIGSCFLVEADSMADVLSFHKADPFMAVGVWEHVHINPFLKRMDNRSP